MKDWLVEQGKFFALLLGVALIGALLVVISDTRYSAWVWGITLFIVMPSFAIFIIRLSKKVGEEFGSMEDNMVVETQPDEGKKNFAAKAEKEIKLTPAPQGAIQSETGGKTDMRALKGFYSVMGDLMWFLTIAAFVVLMGFIPSIGAQPVPFFGTVTLALIYLTAPAIAVLVGFNMLSGRWPAPTQRNRNMWVSGLAILSLLAIGTALYVFNKGVTGLPTALAITFPAPTGAQSLDVDLIAKWALVGVLTFAVIDWWFTKSDDYLASSQSDDAFVALQNENENLKARLSNHVQQQSALYSSTPAYAQMPNQHLEGDVPAVVHQRVVRTYETIIQPPFYAQRRGDMPPTLNLVASQPHQAPPAPPTPAMTESPAEEAAS